MAADQQVTVKFLSDTKGYVRGVKEAEKAQDRLTQSVKETNTEVSVSVDETGALTESFGDLNTAVTATSEGLVDSATGFSGLGAALTSIGTRVTTAVKALSGFQKALIATGIGAALVALGLILVFWEDIAEAIGISTFNLEKFNEQNARELTFLENRLKILEDTGAEQELIDNARIAVLKQEEQAARDLLIARNKAGEAQIRFIEGRKLSEEELDELLQDEFGTLREITQQIELTKAATTAYLNEIDKAIISTVKLVEVTEDLAAANARATEEAIEDEEDEFIPGESAEVIEAKRVAKLLADLNKETQKQIDKDLADSRASDAKASKKTADDEIKLAQDVAAAKDEFAIAGFALAGELAGENAELQLAVDLASAGAGVAVGLINAFQKKSNIVKALTVAAVIANGIAQIASIKSAYAAVGAGGGDSVTPTAPAIDTDPRSNEQFQEQREADTLARRRDNTQVVLVTEDLDRVQNRVAVTESRSSI